MQIIFWYENEKLKLFSNYKLFDTIKTGYDKLIEQTTYKVDKKSQYLVICIYEENPITAFYKIKVCDTASNFAIDHNNFTGITNYENITNILSDVLLMIYNYKKLVINDILVKDENGNKLKPEMTLYYQQICTLKPIENIKYIKKHNYGHKINNLDDTSAECYSDNEILLDLLSQQDLYFTTNESDYVLFTIEDVIYIKLITCTDLQNDKYAVCDYATNSLYKKSIEDLFTPYFNIESIQNCKDAFYNEIFRDNINDKYNKFIKKLEKEEINIENSNLLNIINGLPSYVDHRKKYYEKLLGVYTKREKNSAKKVISKNAYLTAYEQKTIDKTPIGSLKHFIYKK